MLTEIKGVNPEDKLLTSEPEEQISAEERADKLNDLSGFEAGNNAIGSLLGEIEHEASENGGFESLEEFEESEGIESEGEESASDPAKANPENIGAKLDAEGVIVMADVILSRVFNLAAGKLLKKETTPTSFALTKGEKEALKIPTQEYLNTLDLTALTPLQQLTLFIVPIYGAKFLSLDGKEVSGTTGKPSKKGRGRRAMMKDEGGKLLEPRRYEDTGELVNP